MSLDGKMGIPADNRQPPPDSDLDQNKDKEVTPEGFFESRKPNQDSLEESPGEFRHESQLTEVQTRRLEEMTNEWIRTHYVMNGFEDFYGEGGDTFQSPTPKEFISEKIADIVGGGKDGTNVRFGAQYSDGVAFFVGKLLDFVKEKTNDSAEEDHLNRFIKLISEEYFLGITNMATEMDTEDQFILTAKANRVPQVQGWFGGHMVGETVYNLAFANDGVADSILETLSDVSVPELLDVIHQTQTIAAAAVSNGAWAVPAVDKCQMILKGIEVGNDSPIVKYASRAAQGRVGKEIQDPSLSIITFEGNKEDGRLSEEVSDEAQEKSRELLLRMDPNIRITSDMTVVPVAENAIGVLDQSNIPQYIARVGEKDIPESTWEGCPINEIHKWQEGFMEIRNRSEATSEALYFLAYDGTGIQLGEEGSRIKDMAQVCHEGLGLYMQDEWEKYFKSANSIKKIKNEYQELVRSFKEKAGDRNEEISQVFADSVKDKFSELLGFFPEGSSEKQHTYTFTRDFFEAQKEGDRARMFISAENLVLFLNDVLQYKPKSFSDEKASGEIMSIMDQLQTLRDKHVENMQQVHINAQSRFSGLQLEEYNEACDYVDLFLKDEILHSRIMDLLDRREKESSSQLPLIHFESYDEAFDNEDIVPWGLNSEDLPLLFQQIHNPTIKGFLEDDLGISLDSLPLRSEVQLLRFLAAQDGQGFENVRHALIQQQNQKKNILYSFLACAENAEMGETVLYLAENLDNDGAKILFDKYRAIAEQTENVRSYLQQTLSGGAEYEHHGEQEVILNLLSRANTLLKECEQEVKHAREGETTPNIDMFLADFDRSKNEINLFLATFKALKGQDTSFNLETLKDTSIAVSSGIELLEGAEDIETMKRIYARNYESYPQEFRDMILIGFEKKLQDPNTHFYVLRHAGEVVGFDSFTENDDHVYFGSFNVDSNFAGSKLGTAMMEKSLDREAKHKRIEADCNPKEAVAQSYVNKKGFVGVSFENIGGVDSLHIVRDDTIKFNTTETQTHEVSFEEPFSFDLPEGFVVTRIEPHEDAQVYRCVLEKRVPVSAEEMAEAA